MIRNLHMIFAVAAMVICGCSRFGPSEPFPVGRSMETELRELGLTIKPAVPAAKNRDEKGRFITPKCPVCGSAAILSCTTYRCQSGHKYESPDDSF